MKSLSPILTHEWFVFRYGIPTLVPDSVERLPDKGAQFVWRNELHEIYHLTGRCPWTVLSEMTAQMNARGVSVSGIVSDLEGDSYSSQLNLILQHQERLKLPARWFSQFQFDGRELTQPDAEAKGAIDCCDEIESFEVVRETRTFYSWVHQKEITLDFKVIPESVLNHRGRAVDSILLDHCSESTGGEASPVRKLPWPYRNFLAINSDIDWTTAGQLREFDTLTRDAPWGGSAYFSSQSPDWISLTGQEEVVAECRGSIDTLHTWSETIETLEFEKSDGKSEWAAQGHGCFGALVVWVTAPAPDLAAEIGGVEKEWEAVHHSSTAAKNGRYAVVFSWGEVLEFPTRDFKLRLEWGDSGVEVDQCFLCSLDPVEIRRWVAENHGKVEIPIFSFHGGGENVREIAALRTGLVKEREPDTMACDLDDPGSPFYLVPELKKLGVRFLNPRGKFITREIVPMDGMMEPATLDDGSEFLMFRRFLTRKHEELGLPNRWRQGKSASHPEALEFILSDLLQRFVGAEKGTGTIVYTHLGHKTGSQLDDGLEWPVHFRAWLGELHRLSREEKTIWMTSASEILTYADVRRKLSEVGACEITEDRIEIQFEGSLSSLKNQTIFHDNAASVKVFVNGGLIGTDSFRINESPGNEAASITFS